MFAALIGLGLSLSIVILARLTRFDKDVSFYPMLLMFIASFYILFAVIAGHSVFKEVFIASIFFTIAIWGAYRSLLMVGIGIVLHGIYDAFQVISSLNTVAPDWWPPFCASVDFVIGIWVIYLARVKYR